MSYQPINNNQIYGAPQYIQPAPQMVIATPYQTNNIAVAVPYGQVPAPIHVYGQPYQAIGTPTDPLLEFGIKRDFERRQQGTRRNLVCVTICLLILLGIGLAIYFGAIRCRGGAAASGQCPVSKSPVRPWYLATPKEYTHGSQCHEADDQPGDCCSWRSATCLTAQGCHQKKEYSWNSGNGNCTRLMGLLSCAIASPQSGIYADDRFDGAMYMCPNFCAEIWSACKAPDSNPTAYCNGLYGITVRNYGCYSAAEHVTSNTLIMISSIVIAMIASRQLV